MTRTLKVVMALVMFAGVLAVSADESVATTGRAMVSSLAPATFGEYQSWDLQRKTEIFHELEKDAEYQRLATSRLPKGAEPDPDSGVFDAGLRYVPISPRDIQEVVTTEEFIDLPVTRLVQRLHERWLQLHFPDEVSQDFPAVWGESESSKVGTSAEVGMNRNVGAEEPFPPNEYQGEIQLAVNPNNPQQIVVAANSMGSLDCGGDPIMISYSNDGGVHWHNTCTPHGELFGLTEPEGGCHGSFDSDPEVVWDDQGAVYVQYMTICIECGTLLCSAGGASMVTARSLDGGATWSPYGIVRDGWVEENNALNDRNFMEIDTHPVDQITGEINPYYGNQYVCWDRANDEKVAVSTDGGVQWTEIDLPWLSQADGLREIGCDLSVSDNGMVHIVYNGIDPDREFQRTGYSHSIDGGQTWSSPVILAEEHFVGFSRGANIEAQDQRGANNSAFIDADTSGGGCRGTLYVVYTDAPSVDEQEKADIFVIRSTDNGTTWSEPVRVNDDNTDRAQFHPILEVDQTTGDVVVAWQDTRNFEDGRKIDIYVARSIDCGRTFDQNIQVTQPSAEFPNSDISYSDFNSRDNLAVVHERANPNQTGEYIGLDARDGKAFVSWADTREFFPNNIGSQRENLGFAVVSFETAEGLEIFSDGFESGNFDLWSDTAP